MKLNKAEISVPLSGTAQTMQNEQTGDLVHFS